MAIFAISIKCGDKTYNLSVNGSDVYFSSSAKTGGTTLRGVRNYNNELRTTSDNKAATQFALCQAIKASL